MTHKSQPSIANDKFRSVACTINNNCYPVSFDTQQLIRDTYNEKIYYSICGVLQTEEIESVHKNEIIRKSIYDSRLAN